MVEDVVDLFARQVSQHHALVAVRSEQGSLTYGALDALSTQVAACIEADGFNASAVIAYQPERSCWDAAAYLGVLKSGRSFLPIDPAPPLHRRDHILESARAAALLRRTSGLFELVPRTTAADGADAAIIAGESGRGHHFGQRLAYILYTSGSTGSPKGVAMGRVALSYLVAWQAQQDGKDANLTTTQFAPMTFDVAYQELLSTLCSGGTLVVVSEEERHDPARLLSQLQQQAVGRLFLPTSVLPVVAREALRANAHLLLRHVYVAGERLKITPNIRRWFAGMSECRLHNHYGPTETHVVCAYELGRDVHGWADLPPIGRPLPHVQISVRNESGGQAREGDMGELWIGGPAVSEGYVGDPVRTARSFIAIPEGHFYRTGDSVRWCNGQLEFFGRIDRQVKINGYRVEPAEVEATLATHPDIESVVVALESMTSDVSRLVAFVIPARRDLLPKEARRADQHLSTKWKAHAVERLPGYMVPSIWILMPALPLTINGKVDVRSFPNASVQMPIQT